MGRRVVARRPSLIQRLDAKNYWFMGAMQGIVIALLLFLVLWCLPQALAKKEQCGDLGGLYKNGSCYRVSGGIPLG